MKPFILHSAARSDLFAGAEYYERESWAVAGRFAAEMDRLIGEVCAIRVFFASFGGKRVGILVGAFPMR